MPTTNRSFPVTTQYLSAAGREVVHIEHPCGCYNVTEYDVTGEVMLIRAAACGECFDELARRLEELASSGQQQLTLGLPSREG